MKRTNFIEWWQLIKKKREHNEVEEGKLPDYFLLVTYKKDKETRTIIGLDRSPEEREFDNLGSAPEHLILKIDKNTNVVIDPEWIVFAREIAAVNIVEILNALQKVSKYLGS